jgi:hypothetical protein
MWMIRSSETYVYIRTTRRYIQEDGNIHNYRCCVRTINPVYRDTPPYVLVPLVLEHVLMLWLRTRKHAGRISLEVTLINMRSANCIQTVFFLWQRKTCMVSSYWCCNAACRVAEYRNWAIKNACSRETLHRTRWVRVVWVDVMSGWTY